MRLLLLFTAYVLITPFIFAQEDAWFFIRAHEESFEPTFEEREGTLHYVGTNESLAATLSNYKIKAFKQTYRNATGPFLKRTFFVIADDNFLLEELLLRHDEIFEGGELILEEDKIGR